MTDVIIKPAVEYSVYSRQVTDEKRKIVYNENENNFVDVLRRHSRLLQPPFSFVSDRCSIKKKSFLFLRLL